MMRYFRESCDSNFSPIQFQPYTSGRLGSEDACGYLVTTRSERLRHGTVTPPSLCDKLLNYSVKQGEVAPNRAHYPQSCEGEKVSKRKCQATESLWSFRNASPDFKFKPNHAKSHTSIGNYTFILVLGKQNVNASGTKKQLNVQINYQRWVVQNEGPQPNPVNRCNCLNGKDHC